VPNPGTGSKFLPLDAIGVFPFATSIEAILAKLLIFGIHYKFKSTRITINLITIIKSFAKIASMLVANGKTPIASNGKNFEPVPGFGTGFNCSLNS